MFYLVIQCIKGNELDFTWNNFLIVNHFYAMQKLNSELISTAKVKDEQECAWRLEKQVQAQEVQKQKTR